MRKEEQLMNLTISSITRPTLKDFSKLENSNMSSFHFKNNLSLNNKPNENSVRKSNKAINFDKISELADEGNHSKYTLLSSNKNQ